MLNDLGISWSLQATRNGAIGLEGGLLVLQYLHCRWDLVTGNALFVFPYLISRSSHHISTSAGCTSVQTHPNIRKIFNYA